MWTDFSTPTCGFIVWSVSGHRRCGSCIVNLLSLVWGVSVSFESWLVSRSIVSHKRHPVSDPLPKKEENPARVQSLSRAPSLCQYKSGCISSLSVFGWISTQCVKNVVFLRLSDPKLWTSLRIWHRFRDRDRTHKPIPIFNDALLQNIKN